MVVILDMYANTTDPVTQDTAMRVVLDFCKIEDSSQIIAVQDQSLTINRRVGVVESQDISCAIINAHQVI